MDFRILGPLEACDERGEVPLGGIRQRALLALLVVHANETLSGDRLVEELWGERAPAAPAKTLQMHVSRLRRVLGGDADGGARHARPRLRAARRARPDRRPPLRAAGRPGPRGARRGRSAALGGDAGAGARSLARPAARRSRRRAVRPARDRAPRGSARRGARAARWRRGCSSAPMPIWSPRSRRSSPSTPTGSGCARSSCSRSIAPTARPSALQAYQDTRRRLVDELGIEPGERLRELERAILAQDPALALPVAPVAQPAPSPPRAAAGRGRRRAAVRRRHLPADRHRGLLGAVGGRPRGHGRGARAPRRARSPRSPRATAAAC